MKRRYIWLSLLVGLVLFTLLLVKLPWDQAVNIVARGNPDHLVVYLVASLAIILLHAWRWQLILKAKDVHTSFLRALSYKFAGFAVSFVTPGPKVGGEAVSAGLVSRHEKNVRFSKAISTIVIDKSTEIQAFAALFFIVVLVLAFFGELPTNVRVILLVLASLLLGAVAFYVFNVRKGRLFFVKLLRKFSTNKKMHQGIAHFEETLVSFYKEDRTFFIIAHVLSAVAWFISFVEYKYLLLFLGFDVPLYGVFIVYSFVGLAYAIPIPLALGTLEGSQATAFKILKLDPAAGVVLALITRLRDIVFAIIGFGILTYYGISPGPVQKPVR
jgi:glycosyltransferase 2 family protein